MFDMKEWCKSLGNAITANYCDFKSISGQDLEELSKWIDIKKDLAEMEYYEAEKLKSMSIVEAMEKDDPFIPTEPMEPISGYNNRRYASGRYAPAGLGHYGYSEMMPMITREDAGIPVNGYNDRMGYSDNRMMPKYDHGSRYGYSYDKYDEARKNYTATKAPEHKQQMNDAVNGVVEDVKDMLRDMWKDMDPEQKTRRKNELISEISKMQ